MAYGIKLLVWGDLASFNRPEMKVERVSYDVMTPSAARGLLEAIYWKPQMRWVIDRIHVLNPIRFTHVRRNEIDAKIPLTGKVGAAGAMKSGKGNLGMAVEDHRQQRAAMILRDVRYGIAAHVVVRNPTGADGAPERHPEAKHLEMFKRRASRGQYFHHPYLGTREFPAEFEVVDEFPAPPATLDGTRDLGYMLHDMVFRDDPDGRVVDSGTGARQTAEARFFRAEMVDGVIAVPPLETARA